MDNLEQAPWKNVTEVVERIGRDSIPASSQAISNAIRENRFPATWYLAISVACRRAGIHCDVSLFKFKHPPGALVGDTERGAAGCEVAEPVAEGDAA